MSVLHYHQERPSSPWFPHPTLTDLAGALAIVLKVALTLRNARTGART